LERPQARLNIQSERLKLIGDSEFWRQSADSSPQY
jgi:hypothetical protein